MNDGGKNASCCAATGRKLLTSPGVADTYAVLLNIWNTLRESNQQRVYNNPLVTVKRQIQQAENPTPSVVISVQAAPVDDAILVDYLTSEAVLEEPEIGSTYLNIPIDNNRMDDKLHFGIPGGSGDHQDDGDESDMRDAIATTNRQWRPATQLERFDLGLSGVDGVEGEDGDDVYADAEHDALHADDGWMHNMEHWGHRRFDLGTSDVDRYECEHGDDVDADEEE